MIIPSGTKISRLFNVTGKSAKINVEWHGKLSRMLALLDAAESPDELDLPGYHFHELTGKRKGAYSLRVSGNWRLTFEWDDEGPVNIDLEDYH